MLVTSFFVFGLCAAWALENPMEDPNLFEGDMILTEEQKRQLETGGMDPNIPLAATKTRHWPKIIPYDMDSSISSESEATKAIDEAIKDYEKYTCLRFKRRTTEKGGYIHFYRGGGVCSHEHWAVNYPGAKIAQEQALTFRSHDNLSSRETLPQSKFIVI